VGRLLIVSSIGGLPSALLSSFLLRCPSELSPPPCDSIAIRFPPPSFSARSYFPTPVGSRYIDPSPPYGDSLFAAGFKERLFLFLFLFHFRSCLRRSSEALICLMAVITLLQNLCALSFFFSPFPMSSYDSRTYPGFFSALPTPFFSSQLLGLYAEPPPPPFFFVSEAVHVWSVGGDGSGISMRDSIPFPPNG